MLFEALQTQSGLSKAQLSWLATTASKRYKIYQIPKHNGSFRTIAQPSKEIKAIQRWIISYFVKKLPIHDAAVAYKNGSSIKINAFRHVNTFFTLRVDFKNFFPSFKYNNITNFIKVASKKYGINLSEEDVDFICKISCRNNELTIGAPISPILTNVMMFEFDHLISTWCKTRELIYTRYADDIFISSNSPYCLKDALSEIRQIITNYKFVDLFINEEKTKFLSRKYRRTITGLVITPSGKISIGLEWKNKIKNQIYHFKVGKLDLNDLPALMGMLAFIKDVEPTFHETLGRKYGSETLTAISKLQPLTTKTKDIPHSSF